MSEEKLQYRGRQYPREVVEADGSEPTLSFDEQTFTLRVHRFDSVDDVSVRLNWRLLLAPVRIQDYVLVHELAHAVHDDHSSPFWNTVGSIIPDYEDRREWLRLNGNTLTV